MKRSRRELSILIWLLMEVSVTHYRPAMPFGNGKFYFRGSFQFSIVRISKNITLLETWNLLI